MMKNPMIFFEKCRQTALVWGMGMCVLSGCHKHYHIEESVLPEEQPVETTLSLSTEELAFEASGGWKEFTVSCNAGWLLASGGGWCQPGVTAGAGSMQVKVAVERYEGLEDRNTLLVVKAGNLTKTLAVTQKAVGALTVTKNKFNVPQEGQEITVEIKGNMVYEAIIPEEFQEWISKTAGAAENGKLRFTIAANEDTETREGHIFIESGGLRETVYVYQAQHDCLIFPKDTYELTAAAQELNTELRTNVDYEIVIPDSVKGWVSCPPESRALRVDRLRLDIAENKTADDRKAVVIVKDQNSELADTLHIRQVAKEEEQQEPKPESDLTNNFDPKFAQVLQEKGYIQDATAITEEEVNKITKLTIFSSQGLTSLKGIEYFTKLTTLHCGGNKLTTLDVSQNTELTELWCQENQLTTLNVSQNAKLIQLLCASNQLTTLDVSGCTALADLLCSSNQLTILNVGQNTALTSLWCPKNQLTTLDVSGCTALADLYCAENQLTALDMGQNTALTRLWCQENQLTTLDVSGCTALADLCCYKNQLTTLDVSNNTALSTLNCWGNQLTTLDVSKNTKLTKLYCSENQLTTLDMSKNTKLTTLSCGDNKFTTLDVSQNGVLTQLFCHRNQLTMLDVSQNTVLTQLHCYNNQLTTLDVSECTELTDLSCYTNQLTTLDVRQNTALTTLVCGSNKLSTLDVRQNTKLTQLDCGKNQLSTLDVSKNTTLTNLGCANNKLTALDISKNTKLTSLACINNLGDRIKYFPVTTWTGNKPASLTPNYESWILDTGYTITIKYQ